MNTITPRLTRAIHALRHLDRTLKPVQLGTAREGALIEGLHALAEAHGRTIEPTRIDTNGDMRFVVQYGLGYGSSLAPVLSRVPRRTGVAPYAGPCIPENGWCFINHFDVERLLLSLDGGPST